MDAQTDERLLINIEGHLKSLKQLAKSGLW